MPILLPPESTQKNMPVLHVLPILCCAICCQIVTVTASHDYMIFCHMQEITTMMRAMSCQPAVSTQMRS